MLFVFATHFLSFGVMNPICGKIVCNQYIWLVVSNIFLFSIIYGIILFKMVKTANQLWYIVPPDPPKRKHLTMILVDFAKNIYRSWGCYTLKLCEV